MVLYKKVLSKLVFIKKYVEDLIIWLKIENIFSSNVYICLFYIYIHVYLMKTVCTTIFTTVMFFYFIANDVYDFSKNGSVIIAGDTNNAIGNLLDYIETDHVADSVLDIVTSIYIMRTL